jgi:hypothetical protein
LDTWDVDLDGFRWTGVHRQMAMKNYSAESSADAVALYHSPAGRDDPIGGR